MEEDGSEEEECHPTWVEALNVQYNEDDDEEADPDYEEVSKLLFTLKRICELLSDRHNVTSHSHPYLRISLDI